MDQDFFKDYPPVDGSFQASEQNQHESTSAPSDAFVLDNDHDHDHDNENNDEQSSTPIIIGGPPPPTSANNDTNGHYDDSAADEPDETYQTESENPAVIQWRSDFAKRLEERVLNERKIKDERKQQARETITNMHARWDRQAKDAADANAKIQTELFRTRDATLSRMSKKGNPPNWNIVQDVADLSGTFKEGARDTSRMRQVLLRMKN